MDLVSLIHMPVLTFLGYVIPFLVALTVIVFIHEYGHFKVARLCGIDIDTFSIGFGRELCGFTDRYGTRWKIGWIPLGGYVKFAGDANAASMPQAREPGEAPSGGEFQSKPVWQRALVVAAGPAANFILAIVIYTFAFMFVGIPANDARVFEVMPDTAASEAGLKPGDLIKSINGINVASFSDIQEVVRTRAGDRLTIVLERDGREMSVEAVPKVREEIDQFGNPLRYGLLGIKQDPNGTFTMEKKPFGEALQRGVWTTWSIIDTTMRYVGKIITGRENTDQLGGIGSIAKAAGDAASMGLMTYLTMIGFLSVSIGLINLFPIPMLDGGHLVYCGIEALRGKPLGPDAQEWGFKIGFALVIGLMLLGNWNDVVRWLIRPWIAG
jgi:regulator of sigma E protease